MINNFDKKEFSNAEGAAFQAGTFITFTYQGKRYEKALVISSEFVDEKSNFYYDDGTKYIGLVYKIRTSPHSWMYLVPGDLKDVQVFLV